MFLLQKVPKQGSTFGEISHYLLMKISKTQKIVHFVIDRYLEKFSKGTDKKIKKLFRNNASRS